MSNSIINTQTQDITTHIIGFWYTIPYPSKNFHFCFVYAHADILINSLIYINSCSQEEWLHVHPMEDHRYPFKNWFHLTCPGTDITNSDFSDNCHDSQQHKTQMPCMRKSFCQCPQRFDAKQWRNSSKGICFSISQMIFSTKSFYIFFFLSKTFPKPFLVVTSDQYIHTFLQAFLDCKHFPQLEKLLNHHPASP